MNYIPRSLEKVVLEVTKEYPVVLVTGSRIHVDKNQNAGAFWLTGSQVFKLMRRVQESLAGRVWNAAP